MFGAVKDFLIMTSTVEKRTDKTDEKSLVMSTTFHINKKVFLAIIIHREGSQIIF